MACKTVLSYVRFLIENGAEESLESLIPLVFLSCCQKNECKTVKECIELGVDVNVKTADGKLSGKNHFLLNVDASHINVHQIKLRYLTFYCTTAAIMVGV